MKKIFTLCFSLLAVQALTAQNLEIRDNMGTVVNGDTLDHVGLASDVDIPAHDYKVYNVSGANITASCTRYEATTVTGTANSLCWSVCSIDYGAGAMPTLMAPGGPQTIAAGGFCDLFVLHYKPLNNPGTALYLVTFKNVSVPTDSAYFYVRFNATVSVPEVNKTAKISAYPNPASTYVNVDVDLFDENTSLRIVDVLGATVKTIPVNNTSMKISTADLKEGIYFYSLMDRNKAVVTRRLVISR